jgi:hypothetical protein
MDSFSGLLGEGSPVPEGYAEISIRQSPGKLQGELFCSAVAEEEVISDEAENWARFTIEVT